MQSMNLYMVIEHFCPGCKDQVYDRFHKKGRLLPEGLKYVDSWLEKDGNRCFQLMKTDDPKLFETWINKWNDLCDFEIIEIDEKPVNPNDA